MNWDGKSYSYRCFAAVYSAKCSLASVHFKLNSLFSQAHVASLIQEKFGFRTMLLFPDDLLSRLTGFVCDKCLIVRICSIYHRYSKY